MPDASAAALPALLGAHRHCGVGQLEEVRLVHPVLAGIDVEVPSEFESSSWEGREVLEHQMFKHRGFLLESPARGIVFK